MALYSDYVYAGEPLVPVFAAATGSAKAANLFLGEWMKRLPERDGQASRTRLRQCGAKSGPVPLEPNRTTGDSPPTTRNSPLTPTPTIFLPVAISLLAVVLGCGEQYPNECDYPMSQQLAQPCCLQHGIDACGAQLICAALDGRKQPTCYAERSRLDMTECSNDSLCMSGSCNTDTSRCHSSLYSPCDASIGCALDPLGNSIACKPLPGSSAPVCIRALLSAGAPCNYNIECASNECSVFSGQTCS